MRTVKTVFENFNKQLSPSEAYILYCKKILELEGSFPTVYLGGALTTGGFRRDPNLSFEDAFSKNAELSEMLRTALYKHELLNRSDLVFFPADTTSFEGWGQFDYNFFFLMTILNVRDADVVRELEAYLRANLAMRGLTDKSLTRDEKLKSYLQLVNMIEEFVKEKKIPVEPVKVLVQLLDNEMSLGAWAETELARRFGAKVFRVKINTDAQNDDELMLRIVPELQALQVLGVDFFDGVLSESKPIVLQEI